MVERARPCRDLAYVALWLVDAVRVFAWWLMKALVGWGAVLSGDPRPSSEWTADLLSPRALRRDLRFGWEVKHGLAHIETYLARSCATQRDIPSREEGGDRARPDGGSR